MDLQLFKYLSKYPFIFESVYYSSDELPQNKTCLRKCEEKDCLKMLSSVENLSEYVCSKGYDNLLIIVGDLKFLINGLIYDTNVTVPKGRKEQRVNWICKREDVLLYANKVLEIEKSLTGREMETTVKNFSIFHDFKTSMNIFYTCTENIIASLPGITFEQKLTHSNAAYQQLYHALSLITSQLGMIDILINPASISFGSKREINIYKLFDKIIKLFEHMAGKKRNVSIKLEADSWIADSFCYDSIEFIPLILIDNAIKYSAPDSEIDIKMEQHHDMVKVHVKSIGPFVTEENKEKIFEKFFRDEPAKIFSKNGIGIGLWVAQQVLEAHNTKLFYYRDLYETRKIGLNIFTFELATKNPYYS